MEPPRGSHRRLLSGSALFFAGRLAGAGANFLTHWALSKWLGSEQQGQYAEVFTWVLLLANLAILGFPRAGLRFLPAALEEDRRDHVRGYVLCGRWIVLGVSLALITIGGAGVLGLRPPGTHPGSWTMLAGLGCVPLLAWVRQQSGVAHGLSWFPMTVLPPDVVRPLLMFTAVVIAWQVSPWMQARHVMTMQLLVLLPIVVWQAAVMSRKLAPVIGGTKATYETRTWLRTAAPLFLVDLFTGFYPEVNVAIVGHMLSDAEVGLFFIGFRIAYLIAFALIAVDQATLPVASACFARGDRAGLEEELLRATRLKLVCAVGGTLFLAVFGKLFLAQFGEDGEYVPVYQPMMVLTALMMVRAAFGPVAEVLALTGHHDRTLVVSVVSILLTLGLDLVLVPQLGLTGAALAAVVVTLIANAWMLGIVVREVGVNPGIVRLFQARQA